MLGLLGALDPYKHKVNIGMIDQSRDASAVSLSESKSSQDSCKHLGKHLFWFLFQVNIQRASVYKQVVAFFFLFTYFSYQFIFSSEQIIVVQGALEVLWY